MNVLRKIEKSTNGKLVIDLPIEFQNKELEITISKLTAGEDLSKEKKSGIETALRYKGIFKDSTYQVNEADWYEQ
ncbi:MAG TPA: hypothetical protein VE978_14940 [Chitinophagales bacterium]|nr:hypothetical protein [Chitinophagales bacterium]